MKGKVHSSHPGIEGCLCRAREWQNMTRYMRLYFASCETCRKFMTSQNKETFISHDVSDRMWQKLLTDLFKFGDKDFLLTVGYYSKFWEIDKLENTELITAISKLKIHSARFWIPEQVISGKGQQHNSQQFEQCENNREFEHLTSSPDHAQFNGEAKSAVKTAKPLLRKAKYSGWDQYLALLDTHSSCQHQSFLTCAKQPYSNTKHSQTQQTFFSHECMTPTQKKHAKNTLHAIFLSLNTHAQIKSHPPLSRLDTRQPVCSNNVFFTVAVNLWWGNSQSWQPQIRKVLSL